ncbi:hypothetical protein AVEN_207398-1 [Araneus ventricosus]|uniref:RNase H type-1 domain-containing protein n=1 Tax=Araneus ventricosus TaxID=182803 RepID=A0A4Y2J9X9_ARAVE|nr:hypothetical protein AVEN_207398-1 [Araneus ventricosus]
MDQYQHLCRIAGKTWGINKNIRRLLYKTVRGRTLCHGAAAWGHNMTSRLQKKLDSIQRLFLLYITGAYGTTPTAALQVVPGLQPLHLQIQQEAIYARVARARSSSNFFTVIFSPTDYESKSSGIHINPPPNFLLHNQISFAENHVDSGVKAIYTDGSKTDEGTGSAYCILENYGIIASWQGKLDGSNSVFQAEILAIRMAIEAVYYLHRPIKIWTDSLSSLMAILKPKSHHSIVREIQTILLSHKHIHLRWLKAHASYLGNECSDQLAKEAITKGKPFLLPKPLSYLKAEISFSRKNMIAKYITYTIPKTRKKYIIPTLQKLRDINYTFNDMNELQKDGKTEYRSNVIDLFSYLMRNEIADSQPLPGFHTFLQEILDANIPIGWIVNKNVKELILLSQADPKRRDQSSPSTLNESKPKKLTIAERLQTFSNPETSPEPEKEARKKTLSDPESSPTIQLKQWTNWEEAKMLLKTLPISWEKWKN